MTRLRLRPAYSRDELSHVYGQSYYHRQWQDHRLRIAVTLETAKWITNLGRLNSGADLSAGDGAVLSGLRLGRKVFGDLSGAWDVVGQMEDTLPSLEPVDLYICTETLEHLDDPDAILKMIRKRSRILVLSTPVDAFEDTNPEHYWAWSKTDVEEMLNQAGFNVFTYVSLDLRAMGPEYYQFGIWVAQ